MKAGVIHQYGEIPQYEEIADPIIADGQQLGIVRAASIKNIDKLMANGTHYHKTGNRFPAILGVDAVVMLEDGSIVYTGSMPPTGLMAEKAAIVLDYCVPVPPKLDNITAAALPNPAASAWMALVWRGKIQKGDNVLIMGATGVTGKLAIQLAKHFGAGKIIAVGRNENIFGRLQELGADQVISLSMPQQELKEKFIKAAKETPFDIVLDYLWGWPAEILLEALTGHDLHGEGKVTRYIHIGEMAGSEIRLPGSILRSTGLELYGIGGGSMTKEAITSLFTEVIPGIFRLAVDGKLVIDTLTVPLSKISEAWQADTCGNRLVVICN